MSRAVALSHLNQAISEEAPVGVDLREDSSPNSAYYALKDLRNQARSKERAAMADGESQFIQVAEWRPIAEQAIALLQENTKDLELVAWLIEAQVRLNGFAGLAEGFGLAAELLETYWDDLYPLPDEDGLATRIAPIIGLNGFGADGTLIMPIKSVPVTQGDAEGPFATWQCEQAFEVDRIADPERKQQRIAAGALAIEPVQQAVAETDDDFFIRVYADLLDAITQYQRLSDVIDQCCADIPQPTANIRNALMASRQIMEYLKPELTYIAEQQGVEVDHNEGQDARPKASVVRLDGREAALRQIKEVAHYFRGAEPHSPVSYLLEQAIRWANMPLPSLLAELIPDESSRVNYQKLTGIPVLDD